MPLTDDSPKYKYTPESAEKSAKYKFDSCTAKVLKIRHNKEFVDSVQSGQVYCVWRTNQSYKVAQIL